MNAKQRNRFNMYNRTVDFLLAWTIVTDKFPGFPAIFAAFRDIIKEIFDLNEVKVANKQGAKIAKDEAWEKLTDKILAIVDICNAYATVEGDTEFRSQTWHTITQVKTSSDVDLISIGGNVLANAKTKTEKLKAYFLQDNDFDELQELITLFTDLYPKPEANLEAGTGDTALLDAAFENADKQLDKLDALFRIVRTTEIAFYTGYQAVRKILNTSHRKRSLEIWVKNENSDPLEKAKVTVVPQDPNGTRKFTKKTGKGGGINQPNMIPGEYTCTVFYEGLPEAKTDFVIHEGQLTKIEIVLKKGGVAGS